VGPERQRKKKKKRRTAAWAIAGEGGSGLLGLLVRNVSDISFLFLYFQTFFNSILFKSNSNKKTFKLFTKFYKYFRIHPSNQKPCKAK
jgi:hypothetical protein